jgi:hypothetical protein
MLRFVVTCRLGGEGSELPSASDCAIVRQPHMFATIFGIREIHTSHCATVSSVERETLSERIERSLVEMLKLWSRTWEPERKAEEEK